MKNLAALLVPFVLLALAGCSAPSLPTASALASPTLSPNQTYPPVPATQTQTPTILPLPTKTRRVIPSWTPSPTVTSLPGTLAYMRAFPVWDANNIPAATPAPPQDCPPALPNPVSTPVFQDSGVWSDGDPVPSEEDLLTFFNTYGAAGLLGESAVPGKSSYPSPVLTYQDLTHDGVPEVVLIQWGSLQIYGCQSGAYQLLFKTEPNMYLEPGKIVAIHDLNHNQVPEVYLITNYLTQAGLDFDAFEWNGSEFVGLLRMRESMTGVNVAPGYMTFADDDQDGLTDVVVVSQIPVWGIYYSGLPWREARWIFKWDGQEFRYYREYLAPPEFRFQAVQDGDQATLAGEYDRALDFYQEAIFSDQLDGFSMEIREAMREQWSAGQQHPTSTLPAPDPLDYPHLAAYAYYRILLIHTLRGDLDAAQVVFDTLTEKYPAGFPGSIYRELAAEFWQGYQSSQNITQACANAGVFARQHWDEVTYYLGNTQGNYRYFGDQSLWYTDTTLCPF